MKKVLASLMILTVLFLVVIVIAQEAQKSDAPGFKYTGVSKCKMCHKGVKKGNIFEIWSASKHAHAYETLGTEYSMEVAKKAGLKGNPNESAECLVCHVTAYNVPADQKEATLTLEEGNSCEACHGPGSEYKSMKIMKGIYDGTMKGADYGLIEPSKEVCVSCHNPKSPTYKEFKFEEDVKAIAHPVPKSE